MTRRNSLSIKLIKLTGERAIVWVGNIPDGGNDMNGNLWNECHFIRFHSKVEGWRVNVEEQLK